MSELVTFLRIRQSRQLAALADDHDREVLAARVPFPDRLRDLLEVDGDLGDEDHVGSAGDAAHHRDPAGVAAHHLDDHDAVVGFGRRVEAVDRLGCDEHGRVEAERVVRAREVVVDRLRDSDHRQLMLCVQARRDAERVLAADRDERVELRGSKVLENVVDTAVEPEGIRTRRPDDRSAARKQSRDLARTERLEQSIDEPTPSFADAEKLVSAHHDASADRANHRIQAGAISSACQYANLHTAILRTTSVADAGSAGVGRNGLRTDRRSPRSRHGSA